MLFGCFQGDLTLDTDTVSDTASDTDVAPEAALDGIWKLACNGTDDPNTFERNHLEFSTANNSQTMTRNTYSDSNCITLVSETAAGTMYFILGETVTTDSGLTAAEFTYYETAALTTATYYTLVRVDGESLYFGLTDGVSTSHDTPEERPSAINFDQVATKI